MGYMGILLYPKPYSICLIEGGYRVGLHVQDGNIFSSHSEGSVVCIAYCGIATGISI